MLNTGELADNPTQIRCVSSKLDADAGEGAAQQRVFHQTAAAVEVLFHARARGGGIVAGDGFDDLLMGFAGVLEFFGGLLILVGLATRPVAFILSGEMAFAYFMAHAPTAFWPMLNGGSDAILFCFIFLYLSAAGAGPWSVDRLLHRQ